MRTKRNIALVAALVFALFGTTGCDEAFDGDGEISESEYVDSCVENQKTCAEADGITDFDEGLAESTCSGQWEDYQDTESDPAACAAAEAEFYDCLTAENCTDDPDVCTAEVSAMISACD